MSYILNNAITGIDPDFIVDYNLALLSRGGFTNDFKPYSRYICIWRGYFRLGRQLNRK